MTVEQLLQRLVELAGEGKAQWKLVRWESDDYYPDVCFDIEGVNVDEERKEISIQ